jgi:hypothetical protein
MAFGVFTMISMWGSICPGPKVVLGFFAHSALCPHSHLLKKQTLGDTQGHVALITFNVINVPKGT